MDKPIICVVDDEPAVLRAIERDLQVRYGRRFQILPAYSGAAALDALGRLKLRDATVALFLVDQRMPGMTGVAFLEQALRLFPDAKRALLTAYADTDAAIRAINTVKLDHYLLKPWDPPEDLLYPALDDLLDDWQATARPHAVSVRVIGARGSRQTHELKDFLARHLVPYHWLDAADPEARQLLHLAGLAGAPMPVVLYTDGTHLVQPSTRELAAKAGMDTHADLPFYDLIIVGAGPAGLAAAVYASSEGLRTLLIDREGPGGQAGMSARIENYLGFPGGLSGAELARRAVAQARRFGTEILSPQEVTGVRLQDPYRVVTLADGSEVSCHALLIATGVSYRTPEGAGLERLAGAGVYFGAAKSEADSCRSEDVFVLGGGNSAGQSALELAGYARSVTILIRGGSLAASMSHYLIERIAATPNIAVRRGSQVTAVHGDGSLEALTIADVASGVETRVPAAALFVMAGAEPRTDWLPQQLARSPEGYIYAGGATCRGDDAQSPWPLSRAPLLLETNIPGIFVAGDVRHDSIKRVASAVGEGAMAVRFVHEYLASLQPEGRP